MAPKKHVTCWLASKASVAVLGRAWTDNWAYSTRRKRRGRICRSTGRYFFISYLFPLAHFAMGAQLCISNRSLLYYVELRMQQRKSLL